MFYRLSEHIQIVAAAAGLAEQMEIKFRYKEIDAPTAIRYLNVLTAGELIAKRRIALPENPLPELQYALALSVLCFLVPPYKHKPIPEWVAQRDAALAGLYISEGKRREFLGKLKSKVNGSHDELVAALNREMSADDYKRDFISF